MSLTFVLHGFRSANPSKTFFAIEKYFKHEKLGPVIGPTYEFDPDLAAVSLRRDVEHEISRRLKDRDCGKLVFIGISLGGFWAHDLATQYRGISVLINPALNPWHTLKKAIGTNANLKTGKCFNFTEQHVCSYLKYNTWRHTTTPRLVLLSEGDELIDPHHTADFFFEKADIHMFEGGGHEFSTHMDQALPIIHKFITTDSFYALRYNFYKYPHKSKVL